MSQARYDTAGTFFSVGDNSGAKKVKCIRFPRRNHKIGDLVTGVVNIALPAQKSRVRQGDICKAVICELKEKQSRITGMTRRFDSNTLVLVDQKGEPIGTRVLTLASFELRLAGWTRLASLAPYIF